LSDLNLDDKLSHFHHKSPTFSVSVNAFPIQPLNAVQLHEAPKTVKTAAQKAGSAGLRRPLAQLLFSVQAANGVPCACACACARARACVCVCVCVYLVYITGLCTSGSLVLRYIYKIYLYIVKHTHVSIYYSTC
jgi:hypothetical protein